MSVFNPETSNYPCKLLSSIGKTLYTNTTIADVHFVFKTNGEYELIPAHKIFLITASEVFAAMFNGSWKEKHEVEIVDTSPTEFKDFLQFFYFNDVQLSKETVSGVMNLAEMYNVPECLSVCEQFLKKTLNASNVCSTFNLALIFNQTALQKSCETMIHLNATEVFKTDDFLSCDRKVLEKIVNLDSLSCKEIELFDACILWVKAKNKEDSLTVELMHTELGDIIHEIRFGIFTFDQFATIISSYGNIFTSFE